MATGRLSSGINGGTRSKPAGGQGGPMLQSIGEHIWIEEYPFEFIGVVLGRRMTVIRLTDGSLFLHFPGEMTDDRKQCLESLGRVGYIVAPARFHDLFLDEAIESFPSSELHAIRPVFSRFSSRPKTFLLSGQAVSWGGQKSIITIFRPVHFTARRCSFTGKASRFFLPTSGSVCPIGL